ncbi:hypothetical protein FQN60_000879 [Etheostoma spectabile]|uniref:Synaptotagmin-like mitochondrial and lipid-binding domain-containing protein n=1 Tax=Etheostoma spectabile TaxID=54343 RepID=A0A5J5D1J6_9PERO|nr:hypothetical protein FQN60_000879 [Etheostoma spectabile]
MFVLFLCLTQSSIQITFDSNLQLTTASAIDSVTCTDQAAHRMVLHCKCWVDTVTFPVTVTQQSPAAVSMDTFQITIAPMEAKVVVCLEEVEDEGLLISWTLSKQPSFTLTVSPCKLQRQGSECGVDLDMIKGLIEDTLFSTQPAMVLNLKSCAPSPLAPMDHLSVGLNSVPQSVLVRRLLLRQLRATLSKGQWSKSGELCCVLSLDQPPTERTTRFLSVPSNPDASVEWSEEITLELGLETKELRIRLLERNGKREQFLPGHASIALDLRCKVPTGQHTLSISHGLGLAPNATITAELLYVETEEPRSAHNALPLRSSLTPTKKVDVDRTIMPDGTIVTTVTTIQSRLKLDRSPGDSPLRSPSKVEVTEKKPTILSDGRSSTSPNLSKSSRLSNGLDPVAETAIRQLTESSSKVARKTPTKRSTLIISGVSKKMTACCRAATLQPWTQPCMATIIGRGTTRTQMKPHPPTCRSVPLWMMWNQILVPLVPWKPAASRTIKWAFYRVGRSCCSAEDIEKKRPASANPTKTSPTWAITLLPLHPSAAKSPAVSLGVSSNASPSAHQANQKAKLPTEEQAHWITDRCKGKRPVILT